MSNNEKIATIAGYDNRYVVTSCGRVFRKTRMGGKTTSYTYLKDGKYPSTVSYTTKNLSGGWLKPQTNGSGYSHVILTENGKRKTVLIHRLVAKAFIPSIVGKFHINHKDGNKQNNSVNNLEWCTHSENIQHAYDTGLKVVPRGNGNHLTRILDDELPQIKEAYSNGATQRQIAKIYGVDQSHISRILNNHKRGRIALFQTQ